MLLSRDMANDSRKDNRVKIVSLSVRYKSATVDEFIDNHAHDISSGGMFVKTQKAFVAGTLLKFEVRIAGDVSVISGVGRVAWKRDADIASPAEPPGMGVKFIKLDDESKAIVERLTTAKNGGAAAQLRETPATFPSISPGDPIGEEDEEDFSKDETVVRQTRELLEQALHDAGGSLEELMNLPGVVSSTSDPPMPVSGSMRLDSVPTLVRASDGGKPAGAINFSLSEPLRGVATPPPTEVDKAPVKERESVPPPPSTQRRASGMSERRSRPNLEAVAKPRESASNTPWFAICVGAVIVAVTAVAFRDRLFGADAGSPAVKTSSPAPALPTAPSVAAKPSASASAPALASASAPALAPPSAPARAVTSTPRPKPPRPVIAPAPDPGDNPY